MLESKLPFTEDQVRVSFTWYDAFAKGSLLGGRPKLNIALGSFEKACLLFNIAAIQSRVAQVQSRDNDEGLKLSAKLFQVSFCGVPFSYVVECVKQGGCALFDNNHRHIEHQLLNNLSN